MRDLARFWRIVCQLAACDALAFAKAKLWTGFAANVLGLILRYRYGGLAMTRHDLLIGVAIIIGPYLLIFGARFIWNLLTFPAKQDTEGSKTLEEVHKLIGAPGTLQRETMDVCGQIRDFITAFSLKNGAMPLLISTPSEEINARVKRDADAWQAKFSVAFRAEFADTIGRLSARLKAEGQSNFTVANTFAQTPFYPKDALDIAALLFKLAMRLTIAAQGGGDV